VERKNGEILSREQSERQELELIGYLDWFAAFGNDFQVGNDGANAKS
jgi:hypothetical protein